MAVQIDPTAEERRALLACSGDLTGLRVLEIGCGDGRLTWQYAELAGQVIAIDPDEERIEQACRALPSALAARVSFSTRDLDDFLGQERFDLTILAKSL